MDINDPNHGDDALLPLTSVSVTCVCIVSGSSDDVGQLRTGL